MKSVRDIPVFENIPILVRAALNEPVDKNGAVTDSFRLTRALPTLKFLQERGARVVVLSHIDPPAGTVAQGTETLEPVAKKLAGMIKNVSFCPTTIGAAARERVRAMEPGGILVLENLRRDKGEAGNDTAFAKELAQLGDVFVEDSFDTCHRVHASIVKLPRLLPRYVGLELERELTELTEALTPKSPSVAIIAGAKFSTKEPVLTALLKNYDKVFVGGALANDFLRASGHSVGKSLVSDSVDAAKMQALLANPKLVLPVDSRVAAIAQGGQARVASLSDVHADEMILDHGPGTETVLADLVGKAKQVLWNGPLGKYEDGYVHATEALAEALGESRTYSVVGGGDTIAAIEKLNILSHMSFVSEGGGAMLDFLANGTLPGVAALA